MINYIFPTEMLSNEFSIVFCIVCVLGGREMYVVLWNQYIQGK